MPYFSFDGHDVFYEISGRGTPLLYLHGWNESSAPFRSHIAPELEKEFQVITIDLPGFGNSPFFEISYRTITELIASFVEYMEISKITLAGFCLGGTFALDFAITYPQLVHTIFLIDVSLHYPLTLNTPLTPLVGKQILRFFLKTKMGNRLTAKQLQGKGAEKKDFYTSFKDTDIRTSLHYLIVVRDYSRVDHFQRVSEAATFAIHCIEGEYSSSYVKESMRQIVSLVPHASLHTIQKAGHFLLEENTEEILTLFKEALSDVREEPSVEASCL